MTGLFILMVEIVYITCWKIHMGNMYVLDSAVRLIFVNSPVFVAVTLNPVDCEIVFVNFEFFILMLGHG